MGPAEEPLNGGLHAANHGGRGLKTHHVKCAHHLVQLAAGNAQGRGIGRSQVGLSGLLRFGGVTLEGLVGGIQGFAQLVKNPGQGAKVGDGHIHRVGHWAVGVHIKKS